MTNNRPSAILERLPQALVFEAVVQSGTFSDAAKQLGLARSTVSERISALEQSLGVRLLHRTTRSIRLTDAGQKLLDEMAPIIPCWRFAEAQVRTFSTDPKGLLVVTAPDLLMSNFVVPATQRYRTRFPSVRIELRTTTETLPLVDQGIDVALRAGPLPPSGHGSTLWWRGKHIALGAPTLAEQYNGSRPAHLANAPWVDLKGRRALERWTNDSGQSAPIAVDSPLLTDSLQVFAELLLAGAGFGVLPEVIAAPFLRTGTLVRVLEDWHADEVSFHVVTPSPRRLNAAVRFFVEELRSGLDANPPLAR